MFLSVFSSLSQTYEEGTIIICILQKKKLRHREIKYLAHGHTAINPTSKWKNWDSEFRIGIWPTFLTIELVYYSQYSYGPIMQK